MSTFRPFSFPLPRVVFFTTFKSVYWHWYCYRACFAHMEGKRWTMCQDMVAQVASKALWENFCCLRFATALRFSSALGQKCGTHCLAHMWIACRLVMSHHALAICRVALAGIPLVRQKDTDRHVGQGFMARQWVSHWSFCFLGLLQPQLSSFCVATTNMENTAPVCDARYSWSKSSLGLVWSLVAHQAHLDCSTGSVFAGLGFMGHMGTRFRALTGSAARVLTSLMDCWFHLVIGFCMSDWRSPLHEALQQSCLCHSYGWQQSDCRRYGAAVPSPFTLTAEVL